MRLSLILAAAALLSSCAGPASPSTPVTSEAGAAKALSVNPPAHWKVLAEKTDFPIAITVFQVPNPADQGTRDSTNVVVGAYAANSQQAQDALASTKRRFPKTGLATRRQAGWEIESYTGLQGLTRYRLLDGTKVMADKTLFVRAAWPTLPRNAPSYDADMKRAFELLLHDVH